MNKNLFLSILASVVLSFGVVGCGDDDDDTPTIDAAAVTIDAPVGAPDAADPADAGPPSAACVSYCGCMPTNCPTQYAGTLGGSEATCLSMCAALSTATSECRDNHCGMATGAGASTHCPHSVGIGMCQ